MASLVIDHLQTMFKDVNIPVLYVFADYRRKHEQTRLSGHSSLLNQLVRHHAFIPTDILALYQKHVKNGTRMADEEIFRSFMSATKPFKAVYIVMDGIDELPLEQRRSYLPKLAASGDMRRRLNVMFTSRDIPRLFVDLKPDIHLEIRASEDDIRRYVSGHMGDLSGFVSKRVDLQDAISNAIVSSADGM